MSNSRNRDHLQVTLAQFISYAESNSGYCTTCESFTVPSGIEFDSLGDDCGRCGRSVVVGLQVAYDLGYFEPAPIDALAQRMGRVNRKGDTPVRIVVVEKTINNHPLYSTHLILDTMQKLARIEGFISTTSESKRPRIGSRMVRNTTTPMMSPGRNPATCWYAMVADISA